jgi:hypothetical protein
VAGTSTKRPEEISAANRFQFDAITLEGVGAASALVINWVAWRYSGVFARAGMERPIVRELIAIN